MKASRSWIELVLLCFALAALTLAVISRAALGNHVVRLSVHGHDALNDEDGGRLGAVASESSICSRIGVDLIKDGGNAADAVSAGSVILSKGLCSWVADGDCFHSWWAPSSVLG